MEKDKYITVVFDDEEPLLEAVELIRKKDHQIIDVYTPFPVHGLDKALDMKRTRIPGAGFICGAIGGLLGFFFQTWVFTIDYPLVFGGKPYFSVPSFIPVTFELTILFTALGVVSALLIRSRLKPRKKFEPINDRITDDRFVMLVSAGNEGKTTAAIVQSVLTGIATVEIV